MILEDGGLNYHLGHTGQAHKKVGDLHSHGTDVCRRLIEEVIESLQN